MEREFMDFDVVIVGAGPADCLPLADSNKKPQKLAKSLVSAWWKKRF